MVEREQSQFHAKGHTPAAAGHRPLGIRAPTNKSAIPATSFASGCRISYSKKINGHTTSNLAALLRDFLHEQAGLSFSLGRHDCGLMPADWVERVTGRDPAARYRGRYHDHESLMALAGPLGLLRLAERVFGEAGGMVRTDAPELGDVAAILPADGKPRGAIFTGSGFVTAAEQGLWGIRGEVRLLAAWTFP